MKVEQPYTLEQDLDTLDLMKISPISREIMNHQATLNIGTIGHVAHGKSTLVKALSGVQTVRFKQELERNITVKLGYANAKIFKSDDKRYPSYNYKTSRMKQNFLSWPVPLKNLILKLLFN